MTESTPALAEDTVPAALAASPDGGATGTSPPPDVVRPAAGQRGWWRRNRWGLLALVPALVFAMVLPVRDAYTTYHDAAPRVPVAGHAPAWVTFDGAGMRLDALTRITALTDDLGAPVAIPSGVAVWRGTVEFRTTDWSTLTGCLLTLEDSAGATYTEHPPELGDLGADPDFASCRPDSTGTPPAVWRTDAYFVTPANAQAVALRVTTYPSLPRYARLTPP